MMITIATKLNTNYNFSLIEDLSTVKVIIKFIKLAYEQGRSKDYIPALEIGGLYAKEELKHNGHDIYNLIRDF
jgi:hypothetical protein